MNLKRLLSFFKSKIFYVGILILMQLIILGALIFLLSYQFYWFYILSLILSFIASVYIVNREDNPSFKILWVLLIMSVPVMGRFVLHPVWRQESAEGTADPRSAFNGGTQPGDETESRYAECPATGRTAGIQTGKFLLEQRLFSGISKLRGPLLSAGRIKVRGFA